VGRLFVFAEGRGVEARIETTVPSTVRTLYALPVSTVRRAKSRTVLADVATVEPATLAVAVTLTGVRMAAVRATLLAVPP